MNKIMITIVLFFTVQAFCVLAEENVLHIYQDADFSTYRESSEAIQGGIESAFFEVGNQVGGYKVIFKYLDHRGNVIRSKRNYQKFLDDPNALAIYSGIHSPPLIKNRTFINENKALTLVPWAAGGPITRYPSTENWVFRLSLDDTQAGPVIIEHAMKDQQCRKPHLLLEDSPWGNSNLKSMTKALKNYGIEYPQVTRFSWNLKAKGARILLNKIIDGGDDCLVLVSNAVEGGVFANELHKFLDQRRLPIISHWGITGGNFHEIINVDKRAKLNLSFIQTCFAFTNKKQSLLAKQVFTQLVKRSDGAIKQPSDLKSAVGFIHAYDLTKLLIQAIKQVNMTGDMIKDRNAVRLALESLAKPVQGLVKTYNKPFSVFDAVNNVNGHEALHKKDYCMGYYGLKDEILISNEI